MDVIGAGFNVVPVSGSNAVLNALVASGLIVQPFIFVGFLPPNTNDCVKKLKEYKPYPMTLVFYEAPHRLEKMLKSALEVLGDRKCCVAREMTKIHEEFIRGRISEVLEIADTLKGEMVVVIAGNSDDYEKDIDMSHLLELVEKAEERGLSKSEAIKEVALSEGVSKNVLYDYVHNKEKRS